MFRGSNSILLRRLERFVTFLPILLLLHLVLISVTCTGVRQAEFAEEKNWVGTWNTAPQLVEPYNNPPEPGLSNNSRKLLPSISPLIGKSAASSRVGAKSI